MRGRLQNLDRQSDRAGQAGFTLVELLVVISIIVLVSVVALPTVLPALATRQVSEAARILQGALAGARDQAIHDGAPSGLRLLPDPTLAAIQPAAWPGGTTNPSAGLIDATQPLAYNRMVPIATPPEYREGMASVFPTAAYANAVLAVNGYAGCPCLVLEQCPNNPSTAAPNPPTSWFWNVRVGDKVQVNNAGPWYTVVGPMTSGPAAGNTELFVNNGAPGTALPTLNGGLPCEYLLLVDGKDDNGNGWADEGFDGVDNNGNGTADEHGLVVNGVTYDEWEAEAWQGGAAVGMVDVPYTIRRRPAPAPGAREIALPTAMVIDATTFGGTQERSRLPVNPYDGTVDILLNADGTVVPTTIYSSPSSYGMAGAFLHFWLADRRDVVAPPLKRDANGQPIYPPVAVPIESIGGVAHYLPIVEPGTSGLATSAPYIEEGYAVLSLNARTGLISVNRDLPFFYDPTLGYTNSPTATSVYNPVYPFVQAEQGLSSGGR